MGSHMNILLIFLGGGLGSILRFQISRLTMQPAISIIGFSNLGTLISNILGSLVLGIIYAAFHKSRISSETILFIGTGLCGGLTTFSTFTYEIFSQLKDKNFQELFFYLAYSVLIALLFVYIGYFATSKILK